MSQIADQCERYDQMFEFCLEFAKIGTEEMPIEERQLLVIAFKNVIGPRRASIKILDGIEKKERNDPNGVNQFNIDKIYEFRAQISEELIENCETILELLDEYLIPVTHSPEALSFYYKIKAD